MAGALVTFARQFRNLLAVIRDKSQNVNMFTKLMLTIIKKSKCRSFFLSDVSRVFATFLEPSSFTVCVHVFATATATINRIFTGRLQARSRSFCLRRLKRRPRLRTCLRRSGHKRRSTESNPLINFSRCLLVILLLHLSRLLIVGRVEELL